jgi:hypothetical protein
MKKTKVKAEPYIDYETANHLAWMREMVVDAEELRRDFNKEIIRMMGDLHRIYDRFNPKEKITPYGFQDKIYKLKHDFFEAGGNHTLFEKLADKDFSLRFRGFYKNRPVTREEIADFPLE